MAADRMDYIARPAKGFPFYAWWWKRGRYVFALMLASTVMGERPFEPLETTTASKPLHRLPSCGIYRDRHVGDHRFLFKLVEEYLL